MSSCVRSAGSRRARASRATVARGWTCRSWPTTIPSGAASRGAIPTGRSTCSSRAATWLKRCRGTISTRGRSREPGDDWASFVVLLRRERFVEEPLDEDRRIAPFRKLKGEGQLLPARVELVVAGRRLEPCRRDDRVAHPFPEKGLPQLFHPEHAGLDFLVREDAGHRLRRF